MTHVPRWHKAGGALRVWVTLWSLYLASAGICASARAADSPVSLTVIRDVRLLTPEQASQKRPARIRGVVTALSGWKTSFFLQDSSAGISVDRLNPLPEVHAGDSVVVTGYTGPGAFAPVLLAQQVDIVRAGTRPSPRVVHAKELAGGAQDSQWLALRGVIRSAEIRSVWGRDALTASLDIGEGVSVAVRVHDFTPADIARLPGARVTVSGVCGTIFNDRRQFLGLRLFVADSKDIHIDQSAPAQPFREAPFRHIDDLLRFAGSTTPTGEIKTSGVVTWAKDKVGFFLQDDAQGVFVRSRSKLDASVGTALEVVGSPMLENGTPVLQAFSIRVTGTARPVAPAAITAKELITENDGFVSAPYASALVRLDGKLMERFAGVSEDTLLVRSGETLFSARVPRGLRAGRWELGSELRITGVCEAGNVDAHESATIQIQARGPEDIVMLRGAPWWTAAHAVLAMLCFMTGMTAVLGWMLFARWQSTLKVQARTAPLPGLYNRRSFLLLAQKQQELAQHTGKKFHLIFIDVDRFKQMNDQFGHREGDNTLRAIAELLQQVFRKTDVVGRLGGDEFAIATIGASNAPVKRRLDTELHALNASAGRPCAISLSMGFLECDGPASMAPIEELLERADLLMYEQKRAAKSGESIMGQPLAVAV